MFKRLIYQEYRWAIFDTFYKMWKEISLEILERWYAFNEIPRKMTDKELLKDLNSLCNSNQPWSNSTYFSKSPLFKYEATKKGHELIKARRSFGDLFKRYRIRGVSEKQLMRVLGDPKNKFRGGICTDIYKVVFFKTETGPIYKFTSGLQRSYESSCENKKCLDNWQDGKYTLKYLGDLWDKVHVQDQEIIDRYEDRIAHDRTTRNPFPHYIG